MRDRNPEPSWKSAGIYDPALRSEDAAAVAHPKDVVCEQLRCCHDGLSITDKLVDGIM